MQAALWQPAVPQPNPLTLIPTIPSPKYNLTAEQISMASSAQNTQWLLTDSNGNVSSVPPGTPGAIVEGTAPSPDAQPGQMAGDITAVSDPAAAGQGGLSALITNLSTALSQKAAWDGGPASQRVKDAFNEIGANINDAFTPPGHSYWCAAFAAYMLKKSGLLYVIGKSGKVSIGAPDYLRYGQAVDSKQPNLWRKGDVAVIQFPGAHSSSGMHVTFIWGKPYASNERNGVVMRVPCLGGNQGNTPGQVSIGNMELASIIHVSRSWPDTGVALS